MHFLRRLDAQPAALAWWAAVEGLPPHEPPGVVRELRAGRSVV